MDDKKFLSAPGPVALARTRTDSLHKARKPWKLLGEERSPGGRQP